MPDWAPFVICKAGERPPKPRPFRDLQGLGDRLRTAAFAEFQAARAFPWAARRFDDAPQALRDRWVEIAAEEQLHLDLILGRMAALGIDVAERPVSHALWDSLRRCESGRDFCIFIVSAEERGRVAGVALVKALARSDPKTADVFRRIVADEVEHIALAHTYYGWKP